MSFRRTNRREMQDILVGTVSTLPTGSLLTSGNAANIANGQLGIVSVDPGGTEPAGDFVAAGVTQAQVNQIKVVQGTGNSGNLSNVNVFEVGEPAVVESGVIKAGQIRRVKSSLPQPGNLSAVLYTGFSAPTDEAEYGVYVTVNSRRNDVYFGDAGNTVSVSYTAPNYTALGTSAPLDHLLSNLVVKLNMLSKLNPNGKGNKNFFALGIDTGGIDEDTDIGTIAIGDTIDVQTVNGVTMSVVVDKAMLAALAKLSLQFDLSTASVVHINLSTPGDADLVDAIAIIGLDHETAAYFDDVEFVRTNVDTELSQSFTSNASIAKYEVNPMEATGTGRNWAIVENNRARLNRHTMQNAPNGEFFSQGFTYIDPTANYASTVIEYYDYEETLTLRPQYEKELVILSPATYADTEDVDAVVTAAGLGDRLFAVTYDSTLAGNLDASLGNWVLASATPFTFAANTIENTIEFDS